MSNAAPNTIDPTAQTIEVVPKTSLLEKLAIGAVAIVTVAIGGVVLYDRFRRS